VLRLAELRESVAHPLRRLRALDGIGEQGDDVVISPELGEVFEREVDRAGHRFGATQVAEFVELSLSAGHEATIEQRADPSLYPD
jgi:hypothetical protein